MAGLSPPMTSPHLGPQTSFVHPAAPSAAGSCLSSGKKSGQSDVSMHALCALLVFRFKGQLWRLPATTADCLRVSE